MAECTFCEIVAGDREALIVHQTDSTVSFLDHRPLFPGHVLVVPRSHHETIEDLPGPEVGPFFDVVQATSKAVRVALEAQGTFVAANNRVSQSVPHLHFHVVPRTKGDGLRGFFWPRHGYDGTEYAERVRDQIAAQLRDGS